VKNSGSAFLEPLQPVSSDTKNAAYKFGTSLSNFKQAKTPHISSPPIPVGNPIKL